MHELKSKNHKTNVFQTDQKENYFYSSLRSIKIDCLFYFVNQKNDIKTNEKQIKTLKLFDKTEQNKYTYRVFGVCL